MRIPLQFLVSPSQAYHIHTCAQANVSKLIRKAAKGAAGGETVLYTCQCGSSEFPLQAPVVSFSVECKIRFTSSSNSVLDVQSSPMCIQIAMRPEAGCDNLGTSGPH